MRRIESTIPTTVNRLCPTAKGSMHRTLTGANGALAEISVSNEWKYIYIKNTSIYYICQSLQIKFSSNLSHLN